MAEPLEVLEVCPNCKEPIFFKCPYCKTASLLGCEDCLNTHKLFEPCSCADKLGRAPRKKV